MHGEHQTQIDVNKSGFAPAMGRRNHLGKRIPFSELPKDCQTVVRNDYADLWSISINAKNAVNMTHKDRMTKKHDIVAGVA